MSAERAKDQSEEVVILSSDIVFACPSCNKSLVVDGSAEGLIFSCPQCQSDVIVPPRQEKLASAPPLQIPRTRISKEVAKPAVGSKPVNDQSSSPERLVVLTSQLKEIQAQCAELTNRISSRLNEVNHDLVIVTRLNATQQQILSEWNQLVGKMPRPSSVSPTASPFAKPAAVGSGANVPGAPHSPFHK